MMKHTGLVLILLLISLSFLSAELPEKKAMEKINIGPLLETEWGQRGHFAKPSPDVRLGCWSTALAQILYHHRLKPSGEIEYKGSKHRISEKLDYNFNWEKFSPNLLKEQSEEKIKETALYVYYTSIVIGKDFGTSSYIGKSDFRRQKLTSHYKCTTRAYRTYREGLPAVKAAIISELKENRPLMVYISGSESSHAMVIDGVDTTGGRFMVHMNMGWDGKDNGWYDFDKPVKTRYGSFDHVDRWVLSLSPQS